MDLPDCRSTCTDTCADTRTHARRPRLDPPDSKHGFRAEGPDRGEDPGRAEHPGRAENKGRFSVGARLGWYLLPMVARQKGHFEPRRDILLILIGLIAALLVGEGAIRVYFALAPDPPHSRYTRDAATGFRLRPGPFWEDDRDPSDRINSLGFRDVEHPVPAPEGTSRIVGIGDSFVLGAVPIEQNFLRMTGTELGADVALMGLGGYGPVEYLGALRTAGLALEPDRVVLCFYVGNDITGIPMRGAVRGGEVYFTGSSNRWTDLLRHSQLFALAERVFVTRVRISNLRRAEQARTAAARLTADSASTDRASTEPPTTNRPSAYYRMVEKNRLPVYAIDPSPRTEELWTEAEAILDAFDSTCRRAEVPWTLLLIPSELQVDPGVRMGMLKAFHLDPVDYDFDGPQRRLTTFARTRGIDLLDLLPAFRVACARGEDLYIPNDTHWSAAGNRMAANLLAAHLRDDPAPKAAQ
jgi:hypothetical protein